LYTSFKLLSESLNNGDVTSVDVVKHYLNEIDKKKHLNAFLEVFKDDALAQAAIVDQKIKEGSAGKLAGMVIGIKDNICYINHKVSGASKILEGFESLYNATVVERLLKEDAIIIGRLNCDEFAMGGSNENSAFGHVLNPIQEDKVPGGSSGGSAVAVTAGLCLASLGSDTGGSIRQPAAFCGNVGLKPTYGRVSRWGLLAYASSFDQIGPFANCVDDIALIMEVIAGKDDKDNTVSQLPVDQYSQLDTNKKYKIGVPKDLLSGKGMDEEIFSFLKSFIDDLKSKGHEVEEFSFPYFDYMVPTYYILTTAEASANLARYDGAHYGYRSPNATDIESTYVLSRSEGFGEEVKRRIMLGTYVLSAGYYDAYYSKAQKVRRVLKEKTEEVLQKVDFILTPTAPTTAFKIGENIGDPVTMYLQDIFTVYANLVGCPAISLPLGKHSNGLPFGMQLMGKHFAEKEILSFSKSLEHAS
tara:strand:+ start:490 stop:1905 length:1416 start_codon:yes stop_codon:yes gene_type:complete